MTSSAPVVGSLGLPNVSNLYVDGIPVPALNTALSAVSTAVASATGSTSSQTFFSTPQRANGDMTRDVIEVSLTIPQAINRIQFQLAHFPQRAWVQYYNSGSKKWVTFTQQTGIPAMFDIKDSIPALLLSAPIDNGYKHNHNHPQHFGSGHWTPYDVSVNPVVASRLRVVMVRTASETVPTTYLGNPVNYSLGVKDLNVGYRVTQRTDVPTSVRSGPILTERLPIGSSVDVLGSPVDYVVRENRASDLLNGATWKSGPQPIRESVVCLYVDARDSQGYPQVVDRFYLDPLHTGSTANLYYSLDDPDPAVFSASETPLTFPLTRVNGATAPVPQDAGILFPTTASSLDIDNRAVQFDPLMPFQFHGMIQPQFPSTSTAPATFYDDGVLSLFWGPDPTGGSGGAFSASLGSMTATWMGLQFDFNVRLPFTITFDGSKLIMQSPHGRIESLSGEIVPGTTPPSVLRVGGSLEDPTAPGNARVCSFMIKQGNPDDDDAQALYWSDPSAYVTTPLYPAPGPQTTDNAVLRYDPSQQTSGADSINPYGLLGGPGVVYEELYWTPVARDYQVAKGYLDFDPTQARFFKFEFSNLAAEPFETDQPVVLTTNVFSGASQTLVPVAQAAATSSNTGGSGMATNTLVASVNRFSDQATQTTSGSTAVTPTSSTTYLPTQAMVVSDLQGAAQMNNAAPYWNFSTFQANPTMPRFDTTSQHYYETVSVAVTQRVAYFVGLNSIQMFRTDRQTADDTDMYTELFHDANDLVYSPSVNSWALGDGQITTTSTLAAPVTLTSQPYASFRHIQAVQFAATQSPPKQLLTDPDFDDPSLQYWRPSGDAAIVPDPFFNTDVGSLVKVSRGGNPVTWSSLENAFASWNLLEDSDPNPYLPTWDTLEGTTSPSATGGIQSFQVVQPSAIGKLYAAARVIAPAALTAPLVLRLVNGDGTVLAEKPMAVGQNQITEWFLEYDLGSGAIPPGSAIWDDVTMMTWDQMEAMGNWDAVPNIATTLAIHDVSVELVQDSATTDVWYVDNMSIFNDAIMWEFSRDNGKTFWPVWDIRNNPHGVFVFPDADQSIPGSGSQFVWRVTGAAPDLSVSGLEVRFWFDSLLVSSAFSKSLQRGGPNLSPLDQYPDITDDALFKGWTSAIPQDWWFVYRQWVRQFATTPTITQRSFLPDTLPAGVDEGSPADPSYSIMPTTFVRPV